MRMSERAATSAGLPDGDLVHYRFPLWSRLAAPVTVAIVAGAVLCFALWARPMGIVAWLAIVAGLLTVGAEVLKRSMAVTVTKDQVIECDLFRRRALPLARLERARLFRNARLWLYFRGEHKPVWVLGGMGDLLTLLNIVTTRAQMQGVNPEIVRTDKA